MMIGISLYSSFSDKKTVVSSRRVVTKNTGMNAGCRTSHTVCTSPHREMKSR